MARVTLKGSERKVLSGARIIGPADPRERLEVTLIIRGHARDAFNSRLAKLHGGDQSAGHLSRQDFARLHGAVTADLGRVRQFAEGNDIAVVEEHAARRTVMLSGTVAQFSAAFQVELKHCSHPHGTYRGRTGGIQIPAELDGVIEAVLGLDNRPQARTHFRLRSAAAGTSYEPTAVATAYGFPAGDGLGQCVAIIELGGGYKPADLDTYFSALKAGSPKVVAVSVDHAKNAPTGDSNGPDGEVMLDIEVIGAIAPAATMAVYFAPNTDAGFLDAITQAIHDTANKPSIISISWGGPESSWTQQAISAMDAALQEAAAMGITVCVASGDSGSSDGATGDNVDFPASSPHVLACGGTTLQAAGATISSEVVWNDGSSGGATGGGLSAVFPLPVWQTGLKATRQNVASDLAKRGVPDVAGNADPQSGYRVRIDGSDTVIGGTSAVAPLWASLVARLNQRIGTPVGFVNPTLYSHANALRDITRGNNGDFDASSGWDACTGLGSPDGNALAAAV